MLLPLPTQKMLPPTLHQQHRHTLHQQLPLTLHRLLQLTLHQLHQLTLHQLPQLTLHPISMDHLVDHLAILHAVMALHSVHPVPLALIPVLVFSVSALLV